MSLLLQRRFLENLGETTAQRMQTIWLPVDLLRSETLCLNSLIVSLGRFLATHVNRKWSCFSFFDYGFAQSCGKIVSITVKTLRNSSLVTSRSFKVKKIALLIGVRCSKRLCLSFLLTHIIYSPWSLTKSELITDICWYMLIIVLFLFLQGASLCDGKEEQGWYLSIWRILCGSD